MKLKYNDDEHAYWLDGIRCKGVTTLAKIPDDQYRMNLASQRKVAVGLARTPKLIEKVAANIDDDKALNGIVKEAQEAGGANEGRDRGTTAHTLTERHDLGKSILDTPLSAEIIGGWRELIAQAGLKIIPEYVERIICYPAGSYRPDPTLRLCGRLDRIVQTIDGRLVILDVKGGKWAVQYPHNIAVQLAFYANAPLMAGPLRMISETVGETDEFGPMPEVDKEWAIVAHFPEDGPPRLHDFNIRSGWKAAEKLCLPALKWRAKKDLVRPHPMPPKGVAATVTPVASKPSPWSAPDEGVTVDDDTIERLRKDFKSCPDKAAIDHWLKESIEAGRSFHLTKPHGQPSERRVAIIRAAMEWAGHSNDVIRVALNHVLVIRLSSSLDPDASFPPELNLPSIGAALGSLTINQAFALYTMGQQLNDGALALRFERGGRPVLEPSSPPNRAA